jgi:hypothetical protein
MTPPPLAPRRAFGGIVGVWVAAAVAGVLIALLVPEEWRFSWLLLALGASIVVSFAVQLAYGRSQQFIDRVAASALGCLVVLSLVGAALGLTELVPR